MVDRAFRCNSCYKCFADEGSLRDHIPRHAETKHLKTRICDVCGKSYTQETYLARHRTKHQIGDGGAADVVGSLRHGSSVVCGGSDIGNLSGLVASPARCNIQNLYRLDHRDLSTRYPLAASRLPGVTMPVRHDVLTGCMPAATRLPGVTMPIHHDLLTGCLPTASRLPSVTTPYDGAMPIASLSSTSYHSVGGLSTRSASLASLAPSRTPRFLSFVASKHNTLATGEDEAELSVDTRRTLRGLSADTERVSIDSGRTIGDPSASTERMLIDTGRTIGRLSDDVERAVNGISANTGGSSVDNGRAVGGLPSDSRHGLGGLLSLQKIRRFSESHHPLSPD